MSKTLSPARCLIFMSVTGIGCDVIDPQAKMPAPHLSAVLFSKRLGPYNKTWSAPLVTHQMRYREKFFSKLKIINI